MDAGSANGHICSTLHAGRGKPVWIGLELGALHARHPFLWAEGVVEQPDNLELKLVHAKERRRC